MTDDFVIANSIECHMYSLSNCVSEFINMPKFMYGDVGI